MWYLRPWIWFEDWSISFWWQPNRFVLCLTLFLKTGSLRRRLKESRLFLWWKPRLLLPWKSKYSSIYSSKRIFSESDVKWWELQRNFPISANLIFISFYRLQNLTQLGIASSLATEKLFLFFYYEIDSLCWFLKKTASRSSEGIFLRSLQQPIHAVSHRTGSL